MTLLLIDSFDGEDLAYKYQNNLGTITANGRNGKGLSMPNGDRTVTRFLTAAEEHATLIAGFALYNVGTFSGRDVFQFRSDNNATLHTAFYFNSSGTIIVHRANTVLGETTKALKPNAWYYIEIKCILSDTAGSVVIRVNNEVWLNLTNVDTKNAGTKTVFDAVRFYNSSFSNERLYDDFYLCNGAGTIRNDFLGDSVVEFKLPSGNGANSGLLGSDGNSIDNFLLVDDVPPATADYVGSATDGAKDTYVVQDLTRTTGNILGVQANLIMAKSDTGAKSGRALARVGVTDYAGTTKALTQTYESQTHMWQQSPASAVDWTIAEFNGAEFGMEVQP